MTLSPLIGAASRGQTSEVLALLDAGAPIETFQATGCRMNRGVAAGTVPGSLNEAGNETPLICAAKNGRADTAKALLDRGARVNAVDYLQRTALLYAAAYGYKEVAAVLLSRGANPDLPARNGETALSLALQRGHADLADLIRRAKNGERSDAPAVAASREPAPSGGGSALTKDDLRRMLKEVAAEAPAASVPSGLKPSSVGRPGYSAPEDPDAFALVVGIEKYSDLPEAQFAERDAEAVKNHLLGLGVPSRNLIHLAGARAGKAGLEKYLEQWLPRMVKPSSRVYFYFSGHGAPDTRSGTAYLVPWDGDPNFLETTGYPVKRLYERLAALKAAEVVVAMDACFSGAGGRSVLAKGARPLVTEVDAGGPSQGRIVALTASAANEISGALPEEGHGAFTYFLLKGLSGAAADDAGRVTVQGLYKYLSPKVRDSAQRQNRDQTPQLLPGSPAMAELKLR